MKYYIHIGDGRYLLVSNHEHPRVVAGNPDPFSRVARPRIRWARVAPEAGLTHKELERAKRSRIAYTRFYEA